MSAAVRFAQRMYLFMELHAFFKSIKAQNVERLPFCRVSMIFARLKISSIVLLLLRNPFSSSYTFLFISLQADNLLFSIEQKQKKKKNVH